MCVCFLCVLQVYIQLQLHTRTLRSHYSKINSFMCVVVVEFGRLIPLPKCFYLLHPPSVLWEYFENTKTARTQINLKCKQTPVVLRSEREPLRFEIS